MKLFRTISNAGALPTLLVFHCALLTALSSRLTPRTTLLKGMLDELGLTRSASSRAQALATLAGRRRAHPNKGRHHVGAGCEDTGHVSSRSSRHEPWYARDPESAVCKTADGLASGW